MQRMLAFRSFRDSERDYSFPSLHREWILSELREAFTEGSVERRWFSGLKDYLKL